MRPGRERSWKRTLQPTTSPSGEFSSCAIRLATNWRDAPRLGVADEAARRRAAEPSSSAILGSCVVLPSRSRRRRSRPGAAQRLRDLVAAGETGSDSGNVMVSGSVAASRRGQACSRGRIIGLRLGATQDRPAQDALRYTARTAPGRHAQKLTAVSRRLTRATSASSRELPGANTQGATLDGSQENLAEAVERAGGSRALAERVLRGADVIRESLVVAFG